MQNEKTQRLVEQDVYCLQNEVVETFLSKEIFDYDDIQNLYDPNEEENDDQYPQEIFQWWAVSDYLARKLLEAGEPVIDNDYGTWWGRTCCGQALHMDYSLQEIAGDIEAD